jgi:long-subunit fatty acid transport protein
MRKLSLVIGLLSMVAAGTVRAQEEAATGGEPGATAPASDTAAAPAAAAAPASESKMRAGVMFLPMLMGSAGGGDSNDLIWADLKTAYGLGLSFSYKVIAGLSVGVAPQLLLGVKGKDESGDASKEWDLLLRIAYEYTVIPKLDVYGEVLPGYTIIQFPSSRTFLGETPPNPKGMVIAFGAGAAYDITDQFFVNLGIGYQMGFAKFTPTGSSEQAMRTKFLRIGLGGGMKF